MTEEQELIQIMVTRVGLLRSQGRLQEMAWGGYQKLGRGAIVLDVHQTPEFFYIGRKMVAERLEGERRERALVGIDQYNPATQAVVIGIDPLANGHFLINTILIKL